MESLNENWGLFCSKLEQVKPTSNGIEALWPAHDDKKATLSARLEADKILFKCQAGNRVHLTFQQITQYSYSTNLIITPLMYRINVRSDWHERLKT